MWFNRRRSPRVHDEIQFHRDRLIEDYVASGLSRAEAERRAFLEFGNAAAIEEQVRDLRGHVLDDLGKDLRYGVRTLRRTSGFSIVAVLSLALGIGANSAVFSLINGVMLQTLPVVAPDRLVQLARLTPEGRPGVVSYPLFEQFRDNIRSISGAFAQRTAEQAVAIDGEQEFVSIDFVSGAYGRVLGLEPAAGRLLTAEDDAPSAPPAAVISDGYWQRRFGRSPAAVGKTFTLGERVFTIVGVTPASFRGARVGTVSDITIPLLLMLNPRERQSADFNSFGVIARLSADATVAQANAEVQAIYQGFVNAHAARVPEKDRAAILRQRAAALPAPGGINPVRDAIAAPLLLLMGIAALILLLACVNLSGLLLARAASRQREIAIRLAIGAGRGRLVRQFLTESLLLASAGGVVGFVIAGRLSERLFTLFTTGRTLAISVAPDWRVAVFTAAVALVATVAAGLVPAIQAVRVSVTPGLKEARAWAAAAGEVARRGATCDLDGAGRQRDVVSRHARQAVRRRPRLRGGWAVCRGRATQPSLPCRAHLAGARGRHRATARAARAAVRLRRADAPRRRQPVDAPDSGRGLHVSSRRRRKRRLQRRRAGVFRHARHAARLGARVHRSRHGRRADGSDRQRELRAPFLCGRVTAWTSRHVGGDHLPDRRRRARREVSEPSRCGDDHDVHRIAAAAGGAAVELQLSAAPVRRDAGRCRVHARSRGARRRPGLAGPIGQTIRRDHRA